MPDRDDDPSVVDRGKEAVEKAKTLKERFDLTHAGRTLQRYSERSGAVVAGGIAYFSLASIAAGLLIAVTVASWLIAGNPAWSSAIYDFIDAAVPGIIAQDGSSGIVNPSTLEPSTVSGIVGFVAFLILFNTASRYVTGLRTGVRDMLDAADRSPLAGKLRDLAALLGIAVLVILGAALQVGTSVVAEQLSELLFDQVPQQWVVRLSGAGVIFLVDMAFAAITLAFLGGARLPRKYMLTTIAVAALAMAILRQLTSLFVSGAASNPVLGPFAAIVTLLLFVNFTARILLYAAAFLGTYRQDGPLEVEELSEEFAAWARDQAGASIVAHAPGVVRVDTGAGDIDVDMHRVDDGAIEVSLAPTIGSPWPAMRAQSLPIAENYAVFSLAAVARERAGIDERLVVRSGADSVLPDVRLGSSGDDAFPFILEFGGEELARFARGSDAREAGLYLPVPLREIADAVMTPDGGDLLGMPAGQKPRLGDRLRALVRL